MKMYSKVDKSRYIQIIAPSIVAFLAFVVLFILYLRGKNGVKLYDVEGTFCASVFLFIFFYINVYRYHYELLNGELKIKFGPVVLLTARISDITNISNKRKNPSLHGLSFDYISLKLKNKGEFNISPKDKVRMIEILTEINKEIVVDTNVYKTMRR